MAEGSDASPTPSGSRRGSGAPRGGGGLTAEYSVHRFRSFLRVRPYLKDEVSDATSEMDTEHSGLEIDEGDDRINLLDTADLMKPGKHGSTAKRREWAPSGFDSLLWSFGIDPWVRAGKPKPYADEVDHVYRDQADVYSAVVEPGSEGGVVAGMYRGENQAVLAYGGAGSGKSYTMFGDASEPGLALRILDDVWEKRHASCTAAGETLSVQLSMVLVRVFMERVEDVTRACFNPPSPAPARARSLRKPRTGGIKDNSLWLGDDVGVFEGAKRIEIRADGSVPREQAEPFMINTAQDLEAARQALLRYGARKERRAHAVVLLRCRQTSHFDADYVKDELELDDDVDDDEEGADDMKKAKAGRWAQITLVDVGAGKKKPEERDDRGYLPKSRFELSQCVRSLQHKTAVEEQWEETRRQYQGSVREGAAKAGRVQYGSSKLTQLLQEALGGNCRTTVVCCVGPHLSYRQETIDTIEFGRTARLIRSKVKRNQQQMFENLRKKLETKREVKEAIHRVSENVTQVMDELRLRRLRIEEEEDRQVLVEQRLKDRESTMEGLERDRRVFASDIAAHRRVRQRSKRTASAGAIAEADALRERLRRAQTGMESFRTDTDMLKYRGSILMDICVLSTVLVRDIHELLFLGQPAVGDTLELLQGDAWKRVRVTAVPNETTPELCPGRVVAAGPAEAARRGTVLAAAVSIEDDCRVYPVRWWDAEAGEEEEEEPEGALHIFAVPGSLEAQRMDTGAFQVTESAPGGDVHHEVPVKSVGECTRLWDPPCRHSRCVSLIRKRAPLHRTAPKAPRAPSSNLHLPDALSEYVQELTLAHRALAEDGGLVRWPPRPLSEVQSALNAAFSRELGELHKASVGTKCKGTPAGADVLRKGFDRFAEVAAKPPPSVARAVAAEKEATELAQAAAKAGTWPPAKPLLHWLQELPAELLPVARELKKGRFASAAPRRGSLFTPNASVKELARWRETVQTASAVVSAVRARLEAVVDIEAARMQAETGAAELHALFHRVSASVEPSVELYQVLSQRDKHQAEIQSLTQARDSCAASASQAQKAVSVIEEQHKAKQQQALKPPPSSCAIL
eukprot:TRINITY_DN42956_c0_g1_i1.p1 TRINITY_DN42956_c0_g1~~TRINITY_DN42956_c0_g1_i1.p1  ORF type:complete len:1102 (+),score=318.73 TRINITY_DN42956_c0_g1_i1:53-3307(+)